MFIDPVAVVEVVEVEVVVEVVDFKVEEEKDNSRNISTLSVVVMDKSKTFCNFLRVSSTIVVSNANRNDDDDDDASDDDDDVSDDETDTDEDGENNFRQVCNNLINSFS
jgi:hypothetical protein